MRATRAPGRARRSARRPRRRRRRADRPCDARRRRTATSRRYRRCACRFSRRRIIRDARHEEPRAPRSPVPAPADRRRFRQRLLDVVRPPRPRPAVAQDRRPVPHPRVRDHAAADAGRSRAAEVPRVARQIPVARGAGRRRRSRTSTDDVVSARLQHPAAAPAVRSRASRSRATAAQLPADEATLLSFKGIGAYTAGAIRSFAFRERAAILDTNVARVLFRVFVGARRSEGHAMKQHLWTISETVVPHRHVFDFNQALMDFGAMVCVRASPSASSARWRDCRAYPFNAGQRNRV